MPSDAEFKAEEAAKQNDYDTMIENLLAKNSDATFVDGWSPALADEKDFKGRYYFEKLKLTPLDIEAHHALRQSYIEGLMWCLAYYYRGCISWGWFFPYHYGTLPSIIFCKTWVSRCNTNFIAIFKFFAVYFLAN